MITLHGIPASPGVAIGPAWLYQKVQLAAYEELSRLTAQAEQRRFDCAGGRSACPAHTDIPRTHRTGTSNADGKSDRYCNPHSRHSRRFRSGQSRAFPA